MASGVQGNMLAQVYSNRGAPSTSVVLHAWKEIGKLGGADPSSKLKKAARTAVYLCAGTFGAIELTGRGVATWAVRSRVSRFFARTIVPIFVSNEKAEKAQDNYEKARYFVGSSFDQCVHGTAQCFQSISATQGSYGKHFQKAVELKASLDENEVGKIAVSMLEAIDPLVVIALVKAIALGNPLEIAQASATFFMNFTYPLLNKVLPRLAKHAQPCDLSANEGSKIRVQKLALSQIKDIDSLTFIPPLFIKMDYFFEEHVCPITGKSIRFIKEVRGDDGSIVCYEKQAIKEWLLSNPKEPPLHWPIETPYEKTSLQDNLKIQLEINGRMEHIIEKFQEEAAEIARDLIETDYLNIRNS